MTPALSAGLPLAAALALGLAGGICVGLVHFGLLARNVALFAAGRAAAAFALQLARIAATAAALVLLARAGGAAALVAALAGLLAARAFVLRRARREPH
ncbi:MAG TPA: ATP synthase subunit I [Dokdonella sp.]